MTSLASYDKDFCQQKIDSAIALIRRLLDGDYPHRDSLRALEKLCTVYESKRDLLLSLDDTAKTDTILEHCRQVNICLGRFKEFIGFLLRSSNIRNAFELYFPIRILASELVGPAASVVLGSEWTFSPYTYPAALDELPEFIFIGIPASESQNPLILPLAGHELGHVVWRRKGAMQEFETRIRASVLALYRSNWAEFGKLFGEADVSKLETDLFLRSVWGQSYRLAQRQLEEVFCDFVGLYVFGQSFLYSFRYLLAPSLGYVRAVHYPLLATRVKFLIEAAKHYQLQDKVVGYDEVFSEQEPKMSTTDFFVVKMADRTTATLYKDLLPLVEKYHGTAEIFSEKASEEAIACSCLRQMVPAAKAKSISAIVNAAWDIRLDLNNWNVLEEIDDPDRRRVEKLRVLRDVVLKSFEIYEFNKRLERNAT